MKVQLFCLEFSFHDSSYSSDINFPQDAALGKIINSKNDTTLEQDWFQKIS